jgi:hypothetical protein
LLAGPKSLGGPVALQLWRRDVSGAFERICFGDAPVYSEALDAWVIAEGRALFIAEDRAGKRRWRNEIEYARAEAEKAQAEAEKAQADANRERAARDAIERELLALKARLAKP